MRELNEYELRELGRIATDWQNKHDKGEMPDILYKALHGDSSAHNWVEKKVVESLGRHSVIVKDDGTLCDWNEVKAQWKYTRSLFFRYGICMACNKLNIVEHCILTNQKDGREITVGNECVFNFIKIVVDGIELEGAEKREFLRDQMNEARKIFKAQQFNLRHPNGMSEIDELKDIDEYYGWKLCMKALKRITKYGYMGEKMEEKFVDVFNRQDELRTEMNNAHAREAKELKDRQDRALRIRQEREATRRHEAALADATSVGYSPTKASATGEAMPAPEVRRGDPVMIEAAATFKAMEPFLKNDWEKKFVRDNATNLAKGKVMSVRQKEIWDGIVTRAETTIINEDHEMVILIDTLDQAKYSAWEKKFIIDIRGRFRTGATSVTRMSPKQRNMTRKLIRKGAQVVPESLGEEE